MTWPINICDLHRLHREAEFVLSGLKMCSLSLSLHTPNLHDMIHSYVWHDSFIRVTWPIHSYDMTHSYIWHDQFIRYICTCDTTHSYVWHDSFTRDISVSYVTWLIHTWNHRLICEVMWHDSFVRVTRLIHTCDMTHSYVPYRYHMWRDSFMCDVTHSYVTWLIHK